MKTLKKLGKALSKPEQQQIQGGARGCRYGVSTCCGTASWQCGTGPSAGGFFNPSSGTCDCV